MTSFRSVYLISIFLSIFFVRIEAQKLDISQKKYNLVVCAIFQNEAPYLKEWIEHHLNVGVDHFILYNNNSTDDYQSVLDPFIKTQTVELIQWPSSIEKNEWFNFCYNVQVAAYTDAIKKCKRNTKWLAIIDTDEFLISMLHQSVFKTLEEEFYDASGVCVNWQCYGTSHVWLKPGQSLLKNLTYKLPTRHLRNYYYKSIVRPSRVIDCSNPHFCNYKEGYFHINMDDEKIDEINRGVYIDRLRINHYWARDEWFLRNVKVPRYERWGIEPQDTLKTAEEMNQVYDPLFL